MRRWRALLILLPILIGVSMPRPATALTVSIAPAETTVFLGDSFTLRVVVDATPDLKGFEVIHTLDASVLAFTGANPGDVLTSSGRSFADYLLPDVVAPGDSIWFDAAMLQGSSSGPGILVFDHFDAIHLGDSPLQCEVAELRSSFNTPLGAGCAGGLVHVITRPTPARLSSWGALKRLHR